MATKKVIWRENMGTDAQGDVIWDTLYPQTVADQVKLNNTINNNLGIDVDSRLDKALESISDTDKRIRAQGTSTGNALALELSVPTFELLDGTMARVKVHVNTSANATLNVNNTGAKPIIRIDGEPIDLELKQGTWCIFIYSATLDSWVFEGWSTKAVTKTAIFTESGTWTVPANVTSVDVFLMGGGGGGGYTSHVSLGNDGYSEAIGGGGGGGHMTKSTLTVSAGTNVSITVGAGGSGGTYGGTGGSGGTTSFGSSLSAQGGSGGGSGLESGSQAQGGKGGNGGSGGAGHNGAYSVSATSGINITAGGAGGNGSYGGGGGGGYYANGGNGGTYGGGGGAGYGGSAITTGGTYGGNGGASGYGTAATGKNGTDTRNTEGLDFIGEGKGGAPWSMVSTDLGAGGGGGGYGGNGGSGGSLNGGGGGGYGGNAGTYGGGGGYGGNGNGAGGGGYGANNYGCGGDVQRGGGAGLAGKSGICIITYQTQEA